MTGTGLRAAAMALLAFAALGCGLLPSEAAARHRMSFRPGDRSRPAAAHHVSGGRAARRSSGAARHGRTNVQDARRRRGAPAGGDDEGEAVGRPGGGFTMDNGVLTYPAPERFQPRNLKPR